MSHKTDEIDHEVMKSLSNENYISIKKLADWGYRIGTLRGSFARLLADGRVNRQWVGNSRYGKFEYRASR